MSTWTDLYGVEPSRDPADIERWADAGHRLAVALDDLPADGPRHPAVQTIYPDRIVVTCDLTGRMLVATPADGGDPLALAGEVAAIVAGWGCTYLILEASR